MPPLPIGARISYGPSLSAGESGIIPVQLGVDGSVQLAVYGYFSILAAQVGAGPPPPQVLSVSTEDCVPSATLYQAECFNVNPDLSSLAASVQTHSGGNWLSASVSQGAVVVSANPAGLGVGVYVGAVTLTASGIASGQFPVVLLVEGGTPPALVAAPGLVTEFEPNAGGGIQPFSVCVNSTSVPLTFSVQVSTSDGGNWLTPGNSSGTTTSGSGPICINFSVNAVPLAPGNYSANIVFASGTQSVTVPVTLTVAEPPGLPLLGVVASAASAMPGALFPGEVVAIDGLNLGPVTPATPSASAQGQFPTTVSGVTVLIGGIPAPILYASQTLINAQVPYGLTGSSTTVQVQNSSGSTATWTVPLVAPPTAQPTTRPHLRLH
jgi:hypothetical protein